MNYQTTSDKQKKGPDDHLSIICDIKTLERNVDASATKQKQWLRAGRVWVAGPGHVTSKRTKHATNFRFKMILLNFVDLALIFKI